MLQRSLRSQEHESSAGLSGPIFTIGYEGSKRADFIVALAAAGGAG